VASKSQRCDWGECQYRGEGGERVSDCCPSSRVLPPTARGYPSFYSPRREQLTCTLHYFYTCSGMANTAAELTAVLANPAPVEAAWCVLCSYRSDFEGCGAVVG
jgi:hypothetical protein